MSQTIVDDNFLNVTAKASPVGADSVLIVDSEAANAFKPATITSILEAGNPQLYAVSGTAVLYPPSGTIATAGTMTLPNALPQTFTQGLWVYLPASAISGGSEGLYWAVATNTTDLQFKENFVDVTSEYIPRPPDTVGPNATGSNSAYATIGSVNTVLANITIPANAMGLNGRIQGYAHMAHSNVTATVARRSVITFGATEIGRLVHVSKISYRPIVELHNLGVATKQRGWVKESPIGSDTGVMTYPAETTTSAVQLKIQAYVDTADVAANWVLLGGFYFEVLSA